MKPIVLTDEEISQMVDEHLRGDRFSTRKVFDPIDDLHRLIGFARSRPGACNETLQYNGEPLEKLTFHDFLDIAADWLFASYPLISRESWRALVFGILHTRHKGSYVRFRKRPALAAWVDATEGRMSYEQLKAKHPHLKRRRLYQIIEKANKVK